MTDVKRPTPKSKHGRVPPMLRAAAQYLLAERGKSEALVQACFDLSAPTVRKLAQEARRFQELGGRL